MKILRYLILSVILIMMSVSTAFANNDDLVRIGLESIYSNVSSCVVSNDSIEVGYSRDNKFYKSLEINAEGMFYFKMPTASFVKLPQKISSYEEAKSLISNFDNAVIGVDDDNSYYILIQANSNEELNELLLLYPNSESIVFGGDNVALYDGNSMCLAFIGDDKVGFKGTNLEYINVGSRDYRGYIEIYSSQTSVFTLVNVVGMEEYLYSVVPSEMPASWSKEALKAQSVAARTYAYKQVNKHTSQGYNLCDTTDCQMYLGVQNEYSSSTDAVNQTAGRKAYYDGVLIDTVFSSSSGGMTANSEDVWVTEVPYLREKADTYDTEGMVWERLVTSSDLVGMLNDRGQNIGVPLDIVIDDISSGGRVNSITIVGTEGQYTTTKESIRSFFSYGGQPSLPSRLFTISSSGEIIDNGNGGGTSTIDDNEVYVTNGYYTEAIDLENVTIVSDNNEEKISTSDVYILGSDTSTSYSPNTYSDVNLYNNDIPDREYLISGKGYGHGVGMSQYGAKGMADQGYDYIEILEFYYDGIDVY